MTPEELDAYKQRMASSGLASPVDPVTGAVGNAAIGVLGMPSKVLGGVVDAAAAPAARAVGPATGIGISAPPAAPPPVNPPPDLPPAGPPVDPLARSKQLMQQSGLASPARPVPIRKMSDETATTKARHMLGEDAVTKETKSLELDAAAREREALTQSSEARQGGLDSTERLMKIAANRHQIAADDAEDRAASQAVALDAARKQMADTLASLPKDDQVDEGRYWRNQNTGTRVAHGLASFLGNLGEAFAGIKNPVQSMTDAAREDIAQQAAHYDRQRKAGIDKISGLQNIYGMVRQQGFDDEAARKIAENHYLDGMQAKLGAIAARTQNAEEAARAQDGIARLDAYKASNDKALEKTIGMMGARIQQADLQAQYAAQNPAANPKGMHQYSADRQGARIPALQAAIKDVKDIRDAHGGDIPGSSALGRMLTTLSKSDNSVISTAATLLMSNDQRKSNAAKSTVAHEWAASQGMQRNQAYIKELEAQFDGPPEVQAAALARAERAINANSRNIDMGTDRAVVNAAQDRLAEEEAEDADTRGAVPVQPLR